MIRGTSHDQDSRFTDKNKKMLENSTWPDQYDIKIDLTKVDYELIKIWITQKLELLLGKDDDIISGTVISLLDQSLEKQSKPNPKNIHIALSGFLQQHTLTFMVSLWEILDSAQKSPNGIPQILIEEKKKQEAEVRAKNQQIQRKKDKIKGYKFDVIKRYIPRNNKERSRSKDRRSKNDDHRRNRSREHQKSKKRYKYSEEKSKRKYRERSISRDKRKKDKKQKKQKTKKYQSPQPQSSSQVYSSSNSKQKVV